MADDRTMRQIELVMDEFSMYAKGILSTTPAWNRSDH